MTARAARTWVLLLCVASAVAGHTQEGSYDWSNARQLYPGIRMAVVKADIPRPLNINCLQVDTRTPGLGFYTTPRGDGREQDVAETVRQTTRQFVRTAQAAGKPVVAAINADRWYPWPAPWDEPTRSDMGGLAVSEGVLVSPGAGTPSLIIHKDGTLEMAATDAATDIGTIETAVSGFAFVLMNGEVLPSGDDLHPRTGTGLSQDRRALYLMTVDGRQPASGGMTCQELGAWLRHFGADTGINMDGGGSTTMVWWDPQIAGDDKTALLNVPVGGGGTGSERYTGNNLGVCYVAPQQ